MHNTHMIILERQPRQQAPATRSQDTPNEEHPLIRLDLSDARHPGFATTLTCRPDARSAFLQLPDGWLYVATPVGLECFPALTSLLAQASALGLDEVLKRLEDMRPLAFVAGCQRRDSIFFGRSLDGFASLYFGHTSDHLVIADSRTEVARRLGEVRLSRHDEETWCEQRHLDPEGSFYEGVKRCFAGVRYHVPPGHTAPHERHLLAAEAELAKHLDPVAQLTEGLREVFATYGNRKIALRLSGGADSRTLLVGLMDAVRQGILRKDQILCTSVLFPGFDCDETPAIRRIIELSGFEWIGIKATPTNVHLAYERCLHLPAPPFPTSFMGALCLEETRRRDASLTLTGHGGDELFQFDLTDVLAYPLPERLRRLGLIRGLRRTKNWHDEARALLSPILGRRSQRALLRTLRDHHLPKATCSAYRLGRRLALSHGCGYETSAIAASEQGLFFDVPFFRGPFFPRLDPIGSIRTRRFQDKAIAHQYMQAHAPDIAQVTCLKVAFDAAVFSLFAPPASRNRDAVDNKLARAYHAMQGYAHWRTRLGIEGNPVHELYP